MSTERIDKIVAMYERTGHCKGIPQAERVAATSRASGESVEVVTDVLEREGVLV